MAKLKRYTKYELMKILEIGSYRTFKLVTDSIPGLGEPKIGKKYSVDQVRLIFLQMGEPFEELPVN